MKIVKQIIKDVRKNKDMAVRKYTDIFDKVSLSKFKISKKEIELAYGQVDKKTIGAMRKAGVNIKRFAKAQLKQFKSFGYTSGGVTLGQKIIPIESVGVYVPGGRYPLPSTALMCVIPAKLAGVKKIVVCSPKIKPVTIVAADLAGADLIFNIGGVQAIAALAFGTESVPRVDKIVGPGNVYVTEAKKEVYGDCGIDFLAGPSEILVVADKYANYRYIASDLLAQAEHDSNAKITLISDSQALLDKVNAESAIQMKELATGDVIRKAFGNRKIIKVKNLKEAIELANKIAPEHIELQVKKPGKYLNEFKNYGSLFLGSYSPVVFGDYCSGTNHVLPTNGAARYTGGLSVKDFLKVQTYQCVNKKGAKQLAKIAREFALIEGLDAHRQSAEMRLE